MSVMRNPALTSSSANQFNPEFIQERINVFSKKIDALLELKKQLTSGAIKVSDYKQALEIGRKEILQAREFVVEAYRYVKKENNIELSIKKRIFRRFTFFNKLILFMCGYALKNYVIKFDAKAAKELEIEFKFHQLKAATNLFQLYPTTAKDIADTEKTFQQTVKSLESLTLQLSYSTNTALKNEINHFYQKINFFKNKCLTTVMYNFARDNNNIFIDDKNINIANFQFASECFSQSEEIAKKLQYQKRIDQIAQGRLELVEKIIPKKSPYDVAKVLKQLLGDAENYFINEFNKAIAPKNSNRNANTELTDEVKKKIQENLHELKKIENARKKLVMDIIEKYPRDPKEYKLGADLLMDMEVFRETVLNDNNCNDLKDLNNKLNLKPSSHQVINKRFNIINTILNSGSNKCANMNNKDGIKEKVAEQINKKQKTRHEIIIQDEDMIDGNNNNSTIRPLRSPPRGSM